MKLAPPGRRGSLVAGEPGTSQLICPDHSRPPQATQFRNPPPRGVPGGPGGMQAGGAGGVLRWVAWVYNTVFSGPALMPGGGCDRFVGGGPGPSGDGA